MDSRWPTYRLELERVGTLLLAVTELSTGGYVLIRRGLRRERSGLEWRVNVRWGASELTTTSARTLADALERAVQALRKD